jgi:endonuclease YncB( thermonuclease family)
MRESLLLCTTYRLVAFALAVGFIPMGAFVQGTARSQASPGPLTGDVRVVDGDTIAIGATRIRLEGIDAPESAQTCQRKWFGTWPCGTAATEALIKLIGSKPVSCEPRGLDKYGRTLAVCFVDGHDINAQMVRQGYAWAFVRYSTSYVKEEAAAKAEGVGIWQGEAMPAWEFRAKRWAGAVAEQQTPEGCAIKGNITKNGRIYHMPWSPWYAQIRMEVGDKGKRWFCTEAEAVAAGWRPVVGH